MAHQVTADQYVHLSDAIEHWPKKLGSGWHSTDDPTECTVEYLGRRVEIYKAELPDRLHEISDFHGVPPIILRRWTGYNDLLFLLRTRVMRYIVKRYLKNAEIKEVPPLEVDTAALQRDLYGTRIEAAESRETEMARA